MFNIESLPIRAVSAAVVLTHILITIPSISFANSPDQIPAVSPTDASSAEVKITWQDVLKLVDQHPQIGANQYKAAAARAGVKASRQVPNPELEATLAYGQAIDNSTSRLEWGFGLTIPFDWTGTRGAQADAAKAEAQAIESENEALGREVLLQLRLMFWRLVYNQERVSSLEELDAQTVELAESVKKRVEKGEVRPVEAVRVQVEEERISGELGVALSELVASRAQLAVWLGAGPERNLVAVADLTELHQPVTAAVAIEKASTEHPEMLASKAQVRSLTANATVEKRVRIPAFSVRPFIDSELDRRAIGSGLAVELPLWNWNTGNVQQAENMLKAGQKQLDVTRLELETIAVEYQSACQSGVVLATRYKDKILPLAQFASETIERTYKLGEATLLEVIDARRTLLETRLQLLATLIQAQSDCSRLDSITGKEMS